MLGALEVLDPGLLSTIQDAGRPETTHLGVPRGGACDPWSLAVANVLAGADPGAAALEMTIVGPTLAARRPITIGLAGADLGGRVRESGRRLAVGRTHRLEAGATIEFPGATAPAAGARSYLALPGGIDVPSVLGSRSTSLAGAFGGLDGRTLRPGDILPAGLAGDAPHLADRLWSAPDDPLDALGLDAAPIRLVSGPTAGAFDRRLLAELVGAEWRVAIESDRTGLRLAGPRLRRGGPPGGPDGGEILSHGVVWGTIQLPPDGAPIVLLADHQPTGGYPVVAVAIAADRPRLGQLRPGSAVRFQLVDLELARGLLLRQQAAFAQGRAALEDANAWDELVRSAGS